MELKHQLQPHLKRLRLSGILETLEARDQRAIDGQWSYVEFLARLLEDEVERRAQKQLALRLRRSKVITTKTLEGFDFNFNPNLNRQKVLALAACDYIRQKETRTKWGQSVGDYQPKKQAYSSASTASINSSRDLASG